MSKHARVAEASTEHSSNGKPKKNKLHHGEQKPPAPPATNNLDSTRHERLKPQITDRTGVPSNSLPGTSRKRQNKRAKRRLLKAQERQSVGALSARSIPQHSGQRLGRASSRRQDLSTTDPELLRRITCTFLVPRPVKQWQRLDDVSDHSHEAAGAEDLDHGRPDNYALRAHVNVSSNADGPTAQGSEIIQAEQIPPETAGSNALVSGTSSESLLPLDRERFSTGSKPSTTEDPETAETGNDPARKTSITPHLPQASNISVRSGLRRIYMDLNNLGMTTKPLSSMKASTVPSYSGSSDVHSAFKRFDKFANGRVGSGSEEDSEESEESGSESVESGVVSTRAEPPTVPDYYVESREQLCGSLHQTTDDIVASEIRALSDVGTQEGAADLGGIAETPIQEDDEEGKEDGEDEEDEDGGVEINAHSDQDGESFKSPKELVVEHDVPRLPPHSAQLVEEMMASQSAEPQALQTESPAEEEMHIMDESKEGVHSHLGNDSPQQCVYDAARNKMETDLPLFSTLTAATTPVKTLKSASFLGPHHSGMHCASGLSHNNVDAASQTARNRSFSSSTGSVHELVDTDAEADLFRSIAEISTEVFGATRSLPSSKPSRDLPIQEKLALTDTFSNARIDPNAPSACRRVTRSSPIVYICDVPDLDGVDLIEEDGLAEQSNGKQEPQLDSAGEKDAKPSSSPLSQLNYSPIPPPDLKDALEDAAAAKGEFEDATPTKKKRKMTGITSKHWSPLKRIALTKSASDLIDATQAASSAATQSSPTVYVTPDTQSAKSVKRKNPSRKSTAKESQFFTPAESPSKHSEADTATPLPKKRRVPAGTSTSPVPPTTQPHFGLIQEKLWDQPFWLLIAVTFLNKTTGKAAAPIFWSLKERYPTPEDLANADVDELVDMIHCLGLQYQRAKRLVSIARAWTENAPVRARRHRTLHYPVKHAGKEYKPAQIVEEDAIDCAGALEIGHIPGCGPYAWDSWRIFCRDVLRGVAEGFNGEGAGEGFEPEWQRVLPGDKELRACLRWMWLREGWVWDCEGGGKRRASGEEVERGRRGEMEIVDEGERRFAELAAGGGGGGEVGLMVEAAAVEDGDGVDEIGEEVVVKRRKTSKAEEPKRRRSSRKAERVSLTDDD